MGINLLRLTAVRAGIYGDGVCTVLKHFYLFIYFLRAFSKPLYLHHYHSSVSPQPTPCPSLQIHDLLFNYCCVWHVYIHINLPSPLNVVRVHIVYG